MKSVVATRNKLHKFQKAVGLINRTLKPSAVQRETRTCIYNVLAIPQPTYMDVSPKTNDGNEVPFKNGWIYATRKGRK